MGERERLLAAIIADPDDDLPRWVYADWLEEHGEPAYAQFIRVQLQLAHSGAADPRRQSWEQQQRELLKQYEDQWLAPLRAIVGVSRGRRSGWWFRRGFVEYVHVPASLLRECGAALTQATPLQAVYVYPCMAEELVDLVAQPWFGQITELYAPQTMLTVAAVAALVEGRYTQKLRRVVAAGARAEVDRYWRQAYEQRFGVQLPEASLQLVAVASLPG
jgi:uncharacterized protein (TIGR02996 family)